MDDKFVLKKHFFIQNNLISIHEHYEFETKEIGSGTFGKIYKAKMKSKEKTWRAVKLIPKRNIKIFSNFLNEIDILKFLDHPNVLKLYETYQDQQNVYLVTDLFEGGDLYQRLEIKGSFSEEDAREIFRQMAEALHYCHSQKVAHCDLKPQNFMFLSPKSLNTKLIDFGLAIRWKENMKKQLKKRGIKFLGSIYYASPQILKGEFDERCDIWAIGVILYVLVTASFPFDGESEKAIFRQIETMKFTTEIIRIKNVSEELKDLLKKILTTENNRITLKQIFEHAWLNKKLPHNGIKLNFNKLANFAKFSKLKTVAVTMIASQLSEKEIQKLGILFREIDINHDGQLSTEEIILAFEKQKEKTSLEQLSKILRYIDTDKNGKINYTEFISCCLENSVIYKTQNLMAAFKILDKDENGKIEKQQLRGLLQQTGLNYENKTIEEIMKVCDKNGDGIIDYKEFVQSVSKM